MREENLIQNSEEFYSGPPKNKSLLSRFMKQLLLVVILGVVFLCFVTYQTISLNQPTESFPIGVAIEVSQGLDVRSITKLLSDNNVVQSDTLLYYVLILFHDPADIKASAYVFETPLTTLEVAKRLTEGDFDTGLIRFTHIEGERVSQLALRAEEVLPNFVAEDFERIAEERKLEGKLFPETYLIPDTYNASDLLNLLTETFDKKIETLSDKINGQKLSLDEILVLASIIEREANSPDSMRLVSSVLQNRLEIGMALQADASIEYILDKPLSELTPSDLKIDSPYNTYLYPGLPPTPIGNPGLDAIMAVLEPAKSDYFYYITDDEGEFHYAKTYKQHQVNIEKYLR